MVSLGRMFIYLILIPILLSSTFVLGCYAEERIMSLTDEEKAFIEEHPVIRLGVDPKFIPYEFIDNDGEYKGIAADYLQLLSDRTGLTFETEMNLTWETAYEKAVLKQLDVLPCVSKTAEREKYFLYSDHYYSFSRVIFLNKDNNNINNFSDLSNHKIAVQTNSSHHSYLKLFENIELNTYHTVEDALHAVSEGREIAFVGNLATTSYLIKSNGIMNLKFITIDTEEKQSLYFAVRNDWPVLVSIINKTLADITEEEKMAIDNRWIGIEKKTDYTAIIKIVGSIISVVAGFLIVSLYWILKLRKEVEKRKRIEAELKLAKEEAEQANSVKSAFLARMSHEIRTPLNAITGMTYIIKKTDLTTTQKLYLDKISRAARDMLSIINDILDFSKIEAGKVEMERISFNLDEVLEQMVNLVSFKIEEQNIEFSVHKDDKIPSCFWGDPKRIGQVLLNVVNNAMKFTFDGGVSISIRMIAKVRDLYILEFSIKDTGIGMTEEQMSQLFVPFNQADSSISRRFGGTGLGLSIVKSLVEVMGGNVAVFSEPGEGTTFNIQISLEADRNREYELKKESASVYFQNFRVLVLEKNLFNRNLLQEYLNSFNLVAEFTQSEERALQLIADACKENCKPYDLLIVDHATPVNGGVEFCSRLRNMQDINEKPKTILLIPLSQIDLVDKLDAEGPDLGIAKPVIPSVLYNGIMEIFKINVLKSCGDKTMMEKGARFITDYPYKVLIVEDNVTNQLIARSLLEEAGFTVALAENGKEGYEYFCNHRDDIDIILMDLHMPEMDGYEATKSIRMLDKKTPIIAMTADAITGVEEKCRRIGIDLYISKPFEPEKFAEAVWNAVKAGEGLLDAQLERNKEIPTGYNNGCENDNNVPAVDMTDGIRHVGGNKEIYKIILKEYYNENKNVSMLLAKAMGEKNYMEAIHIVHKIKSSSGSIGAKELHEAAASLQKVLASGKTEKSKELHERFTEVLNRVLQEIEAWI